MIQMKPAMYGWYKANNIWIWHTRSHFLSPKYACCACEWVLHGNLCKHQVIVILTCTDLTKKIIIQYCGTRYGFDCGGFATMCVDSTYSHIYDTESDDEEATLKNHGLLICAGLWNQMIHPPMWKKRRIITNLQVHPPHGENACSNGWHNVKNHQWNQRRWGSTHRPHHIIVVCYCNRCKKYSPFQGKWSHASWHNISLRQWWTWQFSGPNEGLAWDNVKTWKYL